MTITDQLKSYEGLMSVKDVSRALGSHIQTIYGWAQEGKLPHYRIGGRIKFDPAIIADWLTRRAS